MVRTARFVLALAAYSIFAVPLNAQEQTATGEDSWANLDDDSSRMALFDDYVVPAKLEDEASAPDKPVDLAIPKTFYFPGDARTDVILKKPRGNSLFGIDISHYTTPDLNHKVLKLQEVRFVYVKATQGVKFKDSRFGYFWDRLHSLDGPQSVSVGAYHFLTAGVNGKEQAKRFVEFVGLHGGFKLADMPPCLDLEWDRTSDNPDRWTAIASDEIIQNAVAWLEYVAEKSGRTPMLYTAKSWLDGRHIKGALLDKLNKYPMWIADYSTTHKAVEKPAVPPGSKPILWQFASDAKLTTGYKGVLDANIYYGSEESFIKDFGIVK